MKTAVAQMKEFVLSSSGLFTTNEVLEMIRTCEIIQDTQIKIAYLHGGMATLQKSEVKADEYFETEFNNSL